jgi:hypothetical protein
MKQARGGGWARPGLPRWAWVLLLVARAVAVVAVCLPPAFAVLAWWWWTHPPDPTRELLAHHGFPPPLHRAPAPELGPRLERWRMVTTEGDTLRGLFRAAEPRARAAVLGRPWGVVMLGGIGTGDRAALLLPDSLAVDALAMDWPWDGPRETLDWPRFVYGIPAKRHALLHAPSALAHGAVALRRERAPARVAVLGASLGSPAASAAPRLATLDALVLVDGMADLEAVFESELRRVLPHTALDAVCAPPLALLAARLTHALEPRRHAAAAAHLPVLVLDAAGEERFPPEAVRALRATYPHAVHQSRPGPHLRPEDDAQVRDIVRRVEAWLRALPDSASATP